MTVINTILRATVNGDPMKQTFMEFFWDTDEPMVIIAEVSWGSDSYPWDIGREMLWDTAKDGKDTGLGDVRLSLKNDQIFMTLHGLDDETDEPLSCTLNFPVEGLLPFLKKTNRHIPISSESKLIQDTIQEEWIEISEGIDRWTS